MRCQSSVERKRHIHHYPPKVYTDTHAHTHKHTHTYKHTQAYIHTNTHTPTHTCPHAVAHTDADMLSHYQYLMHYKETTCPVAWLYIEFI